jgi:hypothetical protein
MFGDPKISLVFQRPGEILQLDGAHRIISVARIPPGQRSKVNARKSAVVGVACVDARGTTYVVEVQVLDVEAFEKCVVCDRGKGARAGSSGLPSRARRPDVSDPGGACWIQRVC